jgi:DNA-binding NarL/FixJ family response regulator
MAASGPTRILLADDHVVVRRGLRLVLESEPDLRVVAEAGDGVEAVRRAVKDDVDLAVLDISMPGMTGLEVAALLRASGSDAAVVFLTVHDDEEFVAAASAAGGLGYVIKRKLGADLVYAVQEARAGRAFVSEIP